MGVMKMYKTELTEEFKSLCEKVISGELVAVQCEGESEGWTEVVYDGMVLDGYPWCEAKQQAENILSGDISLKGHLDGAVYWIHANDHRGVSIGCVYSWKGSAWTESKYFKFPARVALESLRKRLGGGVL